MGCTQPARWGEQVLIYVNLRPSSPPTTLVKRRISNGIHRFPPPVNRCISFRPGCVRRGFTGYPPAFLSPLFFFSLSFFNFPFYGTNGKNWNYFFWLEGWKKKEQRKRYESKNIEKPRALFHKRLNFLEERERERKKRFASISLLAKSSRVAFSLIFGR